MTIPFATSDSWTILSPIEQGIKAKIEAVGTPLRDWNVKINRGILTGCNDAFIVSGEKRDEILRNCLSDKERNLTAELIRPILRGRDVKRYSYEFADQYLIALFPSRNYDIDEYPAIRDYLLSAEWSSEVPYGHGREKLEQTGRKYTIDGVTFTARKKTGNKWFETQDQIGYWDDFSKQKIVWGNLCLRAQYALIKRDYFVNAPSPLITPATPYLLLILNSKVADWYIRNLGVTRNGGYFEYKPMFIEQLPVPKLNDERDFNELYSQVTRCRERGGVSDEIESAIDNLIYSLFSLSVEEIDCINDFLNA